MRAFASRTRLASAASGSVGSPIPRANISTAMREATSPARAPPMPSATTNSGARASSESSFARRWRPVSVPAYCSATRSIRSAPAALVDLEREFALADPNAIAEMQGLGAMKQLLVEVRAVGRIEIFDHEDVPLRKHARVPRGCERILEADLRVIAAPEHELVVEVVDHPRLVARGALDDKPGVAV